MRSLAVRRRFEAAQRSMAASEAHYRLLADNVTDVIALSGAGSVERVYVSPSIEQALGFAPEELLATPNFTYLYPEDREAVLRRHRFAVADRGPPHHRVPGRRTRTATSSGSRPASPWSPAAIRTPLAAWFRSRAISRRRKALETELIEARRRAEEAAAAKSDFLANMTHELRTPLNAIIGFAGVLAASTRLTAEDARHAGLIRDASDTLLDLVNSVLDFSRLEAGAVELERRAVRPGGRRRARRPLCWPNRPPPRA